MRRPDAVGRLFKSKAERVLPRFAVVAGVLAIALWVAPAASADPASDLATAETEESAARSQVAAADQAVAQDKKALAPIEAQGNQADEAAEEAFAKARKLKRELVAERTGAAHRIAVAEAAYEKEESHHSTATGVGIGLAAAAVLLAIAAFIVSRLRRWPLSKRFTQVLGGVLGIVFVGGLVLVFVPAEPEEPEFSNEERSLAADASGNPARPPTPELVSAVLAVKPLIAKARPLEKERREAEAKLESAESEASKARRELNSAKGDARTAHAALAREEKVAAKEAARRTEAHLGHGLGATEATFNANNTIGHSPHPPAGVAWMHVMYKIGSRVAAFNINANFTPPWSAHELILFMSTHNLPEDAEVVMEHESCIVWRSPTLGRLLGSEYAEGFVEEADNKYAELITTLKPECG